jgi:hypothetical protein
MTKIRRMCTTRAWSVAVSHLRTLLTLHTEVLNDLLRSIRRDGTTGLQATQRQLGEFQTLQKVSRSARTGSRAGPHTPSDRVRRRPERLQDALLASSVFFKNSIIRPRLTGQPHGESDAPGELSVPVGRGCVPVPAPVPAPFHMPLLTRVCFVLRLQMGWRRRCRTSRSSAIWSRTSAPSLLSTRCARPTPTLPRATRSPTPVTVGAVIQGPFLLCFVFLY